MPMISNKENTWTIVLGCLLMMILFTPVHAQKFYSDDPLVKEPPPFPVNDPGVRTLSDVIEFFSNTID